MIVSEAVLEAVGAVALVAEHAGDERGVDEGFAASFGALLFVGEDVGFGGGSVGARARGLVGLGSSARPFAGVRTLMGGLCSVVKAELAAMGCWWTVRDITVVGNTHLPFAALTFEGEEVQLPAEWHLAVRADGLYIAYGHLAVTRAVFAGIRGCHGGECISLIRLESSDLRTP